MFVSVYNTSQSLCVTNGDLGQINYLVSVSQRLKRSTFAVCADDRSLCENFWSNCENFYSGHITFPLTKVRIFFLSESIDLVAFTGSELHPERNFSHT